jgi:pilus assembly protein CpaB
MTRRLLAALAALLLAGLGAVVIVQYVSAADARARAGEDLVPVLVVADEVAAGVGTDLVRVSVAEQQVPRRLVAADAVQKLSEVDGRVTNAVLLPGDQLLRGRFSDPAELAPAGTVAAPLGTVEVSVALDAQRAVGGALKAGDKVGVQLTNQEPTASSLSDPSVFPVLDGILVTRVTAPADTGDPTAAAYLVTLALEPADASAVVLSATAQAVWLSLEEPALRSPAGSAATATTATLGDDK